MCEWTYCPYKHMLCTRFCLLAFEYTADMVCTWHGHGWLTSLCSAQVNDHLDLFTHLWILLRLKYLQKSQFLKGLKWHAQKHHPSGLCCFWDCCCSWQWQACRHASALLCRNAVAIRTSVEWAQASKRIYAARIHNVLCTPEGWNYHF